MILAIAAIVLLIIAAFWGWWKYRSLHQLVKMISDKVELSAEQGNYMKIESLPDPNLDTISQTFNNLVREVVQTRESLEEQQAQANSREMLDGKIKEIENSISRLTVISAVGREITGSLNISEILETLYAFISSIIEPEEIELYYHSIDHSALLSINNSGRIDIHDTGESIKPNALILWSYQNRKEALLNDAISDYTRYISEPVVSQSGLKPASLICMPLIHQHDSIGTLAVYCKNTDVFQKYHEEIIRSLSSFAAIAIDNSNVYQVLEKNKEIIEKEKLKSDNLLLNILPADVAQELKETGSAKARMFDNVTVLFSDFVNFTGTSEKMSPEELVEELHDCFKAFDAISLKYNLEKIKTIGDAYLAVCGLPNPDKDHANKMVGAACEMMQFMKEREEKGVAKLHAIRIGINSGPVVAGIVGNSKFAYDIWGDTVNTAARMEQNSMPGRINISGVTYNLIKDQFITEYRGKINAKNKGEIDMYFVNTVPAKS